MAATEKDFDPHHLTLMRVGAYLQHWALMEGQLNSALAATLGLDGIPKIVVAKNTQLRDKLKVISTCIDARADIRKTDRLALKSIFKKIGDISNDRNMIVHEMFVNDEKTGGVRFLVVKAAGRISAPDIVWTSEDFTKRYDVLSTVTEGLKVLTDHLESAKLAKPPETSSDE